MIILKIYVCNAQFLGSHPRNRDCTERMEQWYGNSPSSPIGLFIADLLLPCVKKKKIQIFKQPQSLKFLALLLSTKSRDEKKKIVLLSQAYLSQDLVDHYRNVLEINNKVGFYKA